jgi:hypothetical protein
MYYKNINDANPPPKPHQVMETSTSHFKLQTWHKIVEFTTPTNLIHMHNSNLMQVVTSSVWCLLPARKVVTSSPLDQMCSPNMLSNPPKPPSPSYSGQLYGTL